MAFRPILLATAGAALVAAAPALAAQAKQGTEGANRAELAAAIEANFKKIDSNGDGTVTRAEIVAAQQEMLEDANQSVAKKYEEEFRKLDTDKSGQLSLAEFTAAAPEARPKADPDKRLETFDADKDGKITLAEFRDPVLANFDRVDSNKDGVLSVDEQKKALAQRGR